MSKLIRIAPDDTVAVALSPIPKGTEFMGVAARRDIPAGHKMALREHFPGENVKKYGFPIGHATAHILPGDWVHTHNLATNLSGEEEYRYSPVPPAIEKTSPREFLGYRRPDGRVGVRNEIWVLPTVGCVNSVAEALARENQHLVRGTVEGLYAFPHPFGCSQTGEDHSNTRRLLAALARHPNAGAVLVVSLGCENLTREEFRKELGDYDPRRIQFLTCQQETDEMAAGGALLRKCCEFAGTMKREPIPSSELVIGLKCGGSDGLSGITANPVVGRFADAHLKTGGSALLTEVPEMFGAEDFLLGRCRDRSVFDRAVGLLNGYKNYFLRHGETVYENPSPGNREGGITTLEDKSCGCVQKGGTAPITDVLGYGETVRTRGLSLLAGPGNDLVSTTALTAAGAQILLFTTGRGTPFGAPAPTLKISSNTPLALKKPGWIDFNAGRVADGSETAERTAEALAELVLRVASGEKTCSERLGFREISILKDGVVL